MFVLIRPLRRPLLFHPDHKGTVPVKDVACEISAYRTPLQGLYHAQKYERSYCLDTLLSWDDKYPAKIRLCWQNSPAFADRSMNPSGWSGSFRR